MDYRQINNQQSWLLRYIKKGLFWIRSFYLFTLFTPFFVWLTYPIRWIYNLIFKKNDSGIQTVPKQQLTLATPTISDKEMQQLWQYDDITNKNNRGLRNIGNTCYMNCVLQCLHKSKHFTHSFKKKMQERDRTYDTKNSTLLKVQYEKLIDALWLKEAPYVPAQIKQIVAAKNFMFLYNKQNDATELLSTFLAVLSQQLNTSPEEKKIVQIDRKVIKSQAKIMELTKANDRQIRHSVVEQTFTGRYRTSYVCRQCGFDYILFEKFNIHYVKIPKIPTETYRRGRNANGCYEQYSLQECLRQFERIDQLRGDDRMTCDQCQKERDTDKTMKVCETNKIIVIAIQRFLDGCKDERRVTIPAELQLNDIMPYAPKQSSKKYRLYAACLHSGSLYWGHYTAVCLNYKTNKWVHFNDNIYDQIPSFNDINFDDAYALFYQLCESKP